MIDYTVRSAAILEANYRKTDALCGIERTIDEHARVIAAILNTKGFADDADADGSCGDGARDRLVGSTNLRRADRTLT